MLAEIGRRLDAVLFFDLPDEVATERLLERARSSEGRADDEPEAIARRLATYHDADRAGRRALPARRAARPAARRADDPRGLRRGRRRRSRVSRTIAVIIRKSAARDRADGRRRRRRRRDARPARVASSSPASRWPSSTGSADDYIHAQGGVPTSKGYKGFPAATCISPNDMIVHGIPGDYRAREGDVISFDIGVTKDGMIADSAATFPVGEIAPEAQRLLDVCRAALEAGIEAAQLGATVGDISAAIQAHRRGGRLLGRAQPRRPRRRQVLPRGPAGAELRRPLPRPRARRGHDARDRADDHRRRAPRSTSTTTSGRSPPSTGRWRPTSSTPSRSRPRARGC